MNHHRRDVLKIISCAIGASALPGLARAEKYPSAPVSVIVPYGAGGSTDLIMRRTGYMAPII